MAILMIHDNSDSTLAEYDRVIKELEAAGQGNPPGRLSHVTTRKGTGYLVVDVWESQEALDRFFQVLGPLLQQVGSGPEQQSVQILPVHNVIKGA